MNPIKLNDPSAPHKVLIIAEQGIDENNKIVQPLTEKDLSEFYNKLETLLGEYGFKVDHYGEKEAMIKRLTMPKAQSEYE